MRRSAQNSHFLHSHLLVLNPSIFLNIGSSGRFFPVTNPSPPRGREKFDLMCKMDDFEFFLEQLTVFPKTTFD